MDRSTVDVFIARQPIFDRDRRVAGYELLYRSGGSNHYAPQDAESATAMQLEKTLLTFGFELLTSGRDASINASRTMLTRDHWQLMPRERTVLEVLETVRPEPEVVEAVTRARDAGYRIALDDFLYTPDYEPLLELAHIVKVDFRQHDARERRALARRLLPRGLVLLAEKIETQADLAEAVDAGYSLYQGYFFCKPEMLHTRELPPARAQYLRLLREAHAAELDFDAIEALITQDVALSLKLLRYMHSAAMAWTIEIQSIRQALLALGERAVRQWISLVAVFGLGQGKPHELLVLALTRAHFVQHLAITAGSPQLEVDGFLTGLLSVLDALTDQPMERALRSIAVPDNVRGALLLGAQPIGGLLAVALAWERGDWEAAVSGMRILGLPEDLVARRYADAVLWAEDHAQP